MLGFQRLYINKYKYVLAKTTRICFLCTKEHLCQATMEKALKTMMKLMLLFVAIAIILVGVVHGARRLEEDYCVPPIEACIVNPKCCPPSGPPPPYMLGR